MGLAWSGMGLYLKEAKTPISTIPEDRANQAGRLDSGPDRIQKIPSGKWHECKRGSGKMLLIIYPDLKING